MMGEECLACIEGLSWKSRAMIVRRSMSCAEPYAPVRRRVECTTPACNTTVPIGLTFSRSQNIVVASSVRIHLRVAPGLRRDLSDALQAICLLLQQHSQFFCGLMQCLP